MLGKGLLYGAVLVDEGQSDTVLIDARSPSIAQELRPDASPAMLERSRTAVPRDRVRE